MELINLTPHMLNIVCGDDVLNLPPSGQVARVSTEQLGTGECLVDGASVPFGVTRMGKKIEGLPEPQSGTTYVVSMAVAQQVAHQQRADVCCPGELVRDSEGKVVGCHGLNYIVL